MRRYGVRFLVAVLTFGLGVALSFALGLLRVPHTRISHRWSDSGSCRKFSRVKPVLPTVDSHPDDPLRLIHLEAASRSETGGTRFLVENKSNKTITSYQVSGERRWRAEGRSVENLADSTASVFLEPGESSYLSPPRSVDGGLRLRVLWVAFQDGSRWINPRETW